MTAGNEKLIRTALAAIKLGNVEQSFHALMKIKGLNISFISKVLYFAARAVRIENYPLIFDIRVASNIVAIATNDEFKGMIAVRPTFTYEGYDMYNNMIHAIAKDLRVEAEEVEFFIFMYPDDRQSKRSRL